jgi:hypothetical protein
MTFSTPGTLSAAAASNDFTLPPHTGGRAITAVFIPGSRTSAPYVAVPVVIGTRSIDGIFLPCQRRSAGSLTFTRDLSGMGNVRADATRAPKAIARPVRSCTTWCCRARTSVAFTPHCFAAASSSNARTVAPASRHDVRNSRTLDDPSVFCDPYFLSSPTACSTRQRAQSASISSAMMSGSVVRTPCPISDRWQMS